MYTYLIIDDEELTRKGTIKKLSPMEDQVTCIGEAENGKEGMEKIESLKPDIVLLDMQMPVMDGSALLSWLTEHYPELPLIVISGYRNFDYIKHALSANAVDYVLKPFSREDIQKCMTSAIARLKDKSELESRISNTQEEKEAALYEYDLQILKGLILGYHTEDTHLSSQRLSFINQVHRCALLTAIFEQKPEPDCMHSWIESSELTDLLLPIPDPNDAQTYYLLLFLPEENVISAKPYLKKVAQEFLVYSEQQGNPALIGISELHNDLSQLRSALQETTQALNRQVLSAAGPAYYLYAETTPSPIQWEQKEEFLFRLESGNTEEVRLLTEKLFRHFTDIPDFTLADAKYNCYLLSGDCRRILSGYLNQPTLPEESESIQNVTNTIFRVSELKRYYLQYFLNLTTMLKEQTVYAQDDIIENIKIYMERNYQKDLTQEFISSLFYINRSYLSTLFKARTGEKFIDYLNGIRIEKAKELLVSSDQKLYVIAKTVGYDNVKYFFRIFKKKTGMTPEQYRER